MIDPDKETQGWPVFDKDMGANGVPGWGKWLLAVLTVSTLVGFVEGYSSRYAFGLMFLLMLGFIVRRQGFGAELAKIIRGDWK